MFFNLVLLSVLVFNISIKWVDFPLINLIIKFRKECILYWKSMVYYVLCWLRSHVLYRITNESKRWMGMREQRNILEFTGAPFQATDLLPWFWQAFPCPVSTLLPYRRVAPKKALVCDFNIAPFPCHSFLCFSKASSIIYFSIRTTDLVIVWA